MFKMYQRDIDMLVDQVIELCYFMRGAISYEEMMNRTMAERQHIGDFITKRLEAQKKSPYPVY